MAKIIATDLNLLGSEIQDVRAESLDTPPVSAQPGRFWFDPILGKFMFRGLDDANIDSTDRATHFGTQAASTISDLEAVVKAYPLNTLAVPANDLDIGGFKLTNAAPGVADSDVATVGQVNASTASDRAYIDAQDAANSVADQAYADGLSTADRAYADTQDATLKAYVDTQDAANSVADKAYADGLSVADRAYTDTAVAGVADNSLSDFSPPTADLDIGGFKLTNVAPGVNDSDVATVAQVNASTASDRAYIDTQDAAERVYADGLSTADRAYTDTAVAGITDNSLSDWAPPTAPVDVNGQPITNLPAIADLSDPAAQTQAISLETAKLLSKYQIRAHQLITRKPTPEELAGTVPYLGRDGQGLADGATVLCATQIGGLEDGLYIYQGGGLPMLRWSASHSETIKMGDLVFIGRDIYIYQNNQDVTPATDGNVWQTWSLLNISMVDSTLYRVAVDLVSLEPVDTSLVGDPRPTIDGRLLDLTESWLVLLTNQPDPTDNKVWEYGVKSPGVMSWRKLDLMPDDYSGWHEGTTVYVKGGLHAGQTWRMRFRPGYPNGEIFDWKNAEESLARYEANWVFTWNWDLQGPIPPELDGQALLLVRQDDPLENGLYRLGGTMQRIPTDRFGEMVFVSGGIKPETWQLTKTGWIKLLPQLFSDAVKFVVRSHLDLAPTPSEVHGQGFDEGDLVLLLDQQDRSENGIWIMHKGEVIQTSPPVYGPAQPWEKLYFNIDEKFGRVVIAQSVYRGFQGVEWESRQHTFWVSTWYGDDWVEINGGPLDQLEDLRKNALLKTSVEAVSTTPVDRWANVDVVDGVTLSLSAQTLPDGSYNQSHKPAYVLLTAQPNDYDNGIYAVTYYNHDDLRARWDREYWRNFFRKGEQIYVREGVHKNTIWYLATDQDVEGGDSQIWKRNSGGGLASSVVGLVGAVNVAINQPAGRYVGDYYMTFAEGEGTQVLLTAQDVAADNGLWDVVATGGQYVWTRASPREFALGEQLYVSLVNETWQLIEGGTWVQKYQEKFDDISYHSLAKISVVAAESKLNIDIASNPNQIDGVIIGPPPIFLGGDFTVNPNRKSEYVLLTHQDDKRQNGVWTLDGLLGQPNACVWQREARLNRLAAGSQVYVRKGYNRGTIWHLDTLEAGVEPTDPQTWNINTTSVTYASISAMGQPVGDLFMNHFRITGLAGAVDDEDAVNYAMLQFETASNKAYADTQDATLKAYVDTQDAAERTYADGLSTADRAYTDTAVAGVADNSLSDFAAPTADLSIGTHKLVNVLPGVADTDAATMAQLNAIAAASGAVTLDKVPTAIAPVDLGGQRITNLAAPTAPSDAVTLGHVENLTNGTDWKVSVRAKSTADVPVLSGLQTLDNVALAEGNRALLTEQLDPVLNGIYVVSAGPWTRAADADQGTLSAASAVMVEEGSTFGDSQWRLISNDAITVGTTPLVWTQIGAAVSYVAGAGLDLTGNAFSLQANVPRKFAAAFGNGAARTFTITHNLGSRDVAVSVYFAADGSEVECDIQRSGLNTLALGFAAPPAANQLRCVVVG